MYRRFSCLRDPGRYGRDLGWSQVLKLAFVKVFGVRCLIGKAVADEAGKAGRPESGDCH